MKRIIACLMVVVLAAMAAVAAPKSKILSIAVGLYTGGSTTDTTIAGYIDEIAVQCTTAGASGDITVSVTTPDSNATAYNLCTNTVTTWKLYRPAVDYTSVAGADLTSDQPRRLLVYGDTLTFAVTNSSATNRTWTCRIKYDDGK